MVIIAFLMMLALVPLADRLAHRLSLSLNAEWRETGIAWGEASGADAETLQRLADLPPVAVPQPRARDIWMLGVLVAALAALWVLRNPEDWAGASLTGLLAVGLLVAMLVDIRIQLLPDSILWPLAVLGILISITGLGVAPHMALTGALAGGGGLWALSIGFRILRGQEGLGMGDVKLVAVVGLWLGWMPLPWLLLMASVVAIGFYFALYRNAQDRRMAFGPALACVFLLIRAVGV